MKRLPDFTAHAIERVMERVEGIDTRAKADAWLRNMWSQATVIRSQCRSRSIWGCHGARYRLAVRMRGDLPVAILTVLFAGEADPDDAPTKEEMEEFGCSEVYGNEEKIDASLRQIFSQLKKSKSILTEDLSELETKKKKIVKDIDKNEKILLNKKDKIEDLKTSKQELEEIREIIAAREHERITLKQTLKEIDITISKLRSILGEARKILSSDIDEEYARRIMSQEIKIKKMQTTFDTENKFQMKIIGDLVKGLRYLAGLETDSGPIDYNSEIVRKAIEISESPIGKKSVKNLKEKDVFTEKESRENDDRRP